MNNGKPAILEPYKIVGGDAEVLKYDQEIE